MSPMHSDETYLFIDGAYLREMLDKAMNTLFECNADPDYERIRQATQAHRAFLYDCIDEERRDGEDELTHKTRVAEQIALFDKINELNAFHVRYGQLKGKKRRQQKEVDVLLATEMLTNGYDGNMRLAKLISGDLDFRPVVEALVRRGVYVEVWHGAETGSRELRAAADSGRTLEFAELYNWNTDAFKLNHIIPRWELHHEPIPDYSVMLLSFKQDGRDTGIYRSPDGVLILRTHQPTGVHWLDYRGDIGFLERYFAMTFGPANWRRHEP